jgi:quinol monooxygenase YgiN
MIYGVVSVRVKPGKLQAFLDLFKSNAVTVRQEKGCIKYIPLVDLETPAPIQVIDKNVVTILEMWRTMEDLNNHMASAHMAVYFKKEKEFVEAVSLKQLQEA